jgi:hypothetical protein
MERIEIENKYKKKEEKRKSQDQEGENIDEHRMKRKISREKTVKE